MEVGCITLKALKVVVHDLEPRDWIVRFVGQDIDPTSFFAEVKETTVLMRGYPTDSVHRSEHEQDQPFFPDSDVRLQLSG